MAKSSVQQFSETAASNTDIAGINCNVGWPPPNAGSAFREMMALLAYALQPLSTDVSGQTSVTPTAAKASAFIASYTGALTADCTVHLPDAAFVTWQRNATSGGHAIIIQAGAGTTAALPADGHFYLCWTDGATNVEIASFGGGDLSLTGQAFVAGAFGVVGAATIDNNLTVNIPSGSLLQSFLFAASPVGSITTDGTSTAYNTTSDAMLKHDDGLIGFDEAAGIIRALRPRWFRFKSAPDAPREPGFFAQQVARVFPWAVTRGTAGRPWQMDRAALMPAVVAYIQGLERRIAELEGAR